MEKTMSIPTNLFIDTPEMQDVSMNKLSNDIESWPEEIIQKLRETIPDASGMNTMVKFMKKDEENGTATGSVVITAPEKSAIVPLIVKDFMLFPMDIMIADKKLLPLTPDYFKSIFSSNEVFDKIEEFPTYGGLGRFEDSNMWNAIYPPSLGRYAYASGGYPILEEIADTIDGSEFKKTVILNEKIAAGFIKNDHREIMKKVAHLRPVNMNEYRQGVENLIPKNVAMVRCEGPNKYSLLSNCDTVFNPMITSMDRGSAIEAISSVSTKISDDMNEIDQNGEKFVVLPKAKGNVFLTTDDIEKPEMADSFGHYSVKGKTGVSFEGIVIPKVIDFNQKVVDLKIFIGKNMSSIQPNFAGIAIQNSRFKLPAQTPKVGQTGCFVFQPDDAHGVATVPVTIRGAVMFNGTFKLQVQDMMGKPIKLKINVDNHSPEFERIAQCDGGYVLPSNMKWVPMEGFEALSDSLESYSIKTAGSRLTTTPVQLIATGFGQYSMKGVNKYASAIGWDKTNLDGYQAKFLLASLGAGQEKIAHAFHQASRTGYAELHNLNFIPLVSEKVAKARPLAAALRKQANAIKCDLIKEASTVENSQTVDAMLSLNFVSPENISKFVGKIPHFKSAISQLGSCLLASRMGIKEIPEQAASTAMQRLIEVVNGLEGLRSTQEIGAS